MVVTSCADFEEILPGVREDVIEPLILRITDIDEIEEELDLGEATYCKEWLQSGYSKSNLAANCTSVEKKFALNTEIQTEDQPIDPNTTKLRLVAQLLATEEKSYNHPFLSSYIVANGNIYTLGRRYLRSYDIKTYVPKFDTLIEPPIFDSDSFGGGLSYDKDEIFVATNFKKLFAISSETGKINWQTNIDEGSNSSPIVNGSIIFVKGLRKGITAYSVNGGYRLWSKSTIYTNNDFHITSNLAIQKNPNSVLDNLIVGYSNGDFVVLRAETGRSLWEDTLRDYARFNQSLLAVVADPVVRNNELLASSIVSGLSLYDLTLGQKIWQQPIIVLNRPWVTGNVAYVLTDDAQLVALNVNNGKVYWFADLEKWYDDKSLEFHYRFGPVLLDGVIYLFDQEGVIQRFNSYTGAELPQIETQFKFTNNPIIAEGKILIPDSSGELIVYASIIPTE